MNQQPIQDSETTTFAVRQKTPCKPDSASMAITTRAAKKTPAERTETAQDELFQASFSESAGAELLEEVQGLIRDFPSILSRTKAGTKTMEATLMKVMQLDAGEFVYAYQWDRSWWSRVSSGPVDGLDFGGHVLEKVREALEYVSERQASGFRYPSTSATGRRRKASLSEFLASPMKSGGWWSPFIEFTLGGLATPAMYRKSLGERASSILDGILGRAWFKRSFETDVKFFAGALKLKNWHSANWESIVNRSPHNMYWLSSFEGLLDMVDRADKELKLVHPGFVGPWLPNWQAFTDWLRKNWEVEL